MFIILFSDWDQFISKFQIDVLTLGYEACRVFALYSYTYYRCTRCFMWTDIIKPIAHKNHVIVILVDMQPLSTQVLN